MYKNRKKSPPKQPVAKLTKAQRQRSNLARVAIGLMKNKTKIRFDMGCFAKNAKIAGETEIAPRKVKSSCDTTTCFAGYGPIVLKNGKEYMDWIHYCEEVYGVEEASNAWCFLFDLLWPNSKKQCGARALSYLMGGSDYRKWSQDFDVNFYPKLNSKEIIKRLEKFV